MEKKGILRSKKCRPSVERAQAIHVALLLSQYRLGLSWGGETTGTFISSHQNKLHGEKNRVVGVAHGNYGARAMVHDATFSTL